MQSESLVGEQVEDANTAVANELERQRRATRSISRVEEQARGHFWMTRLGGWREEEHSVHSLCQGPLC